MGQGRVLVTPLHMAMIAGAIANGGQMMEPRLVSSIVGDSGIPKARVGTGVYKRIVSSGVASKLQQYMEGVVESGTGTKAQVDGYTIAGKTGTAEVSSSGAAKPHAWFVGYCADEQHPLAIAIVVENGEMCIRDSKRTGNGGTGVRAFFLGKKKAAKKNLSMFGFCSRFLLLLVV